MSESVAALFVCAVNSHVALAAALRAVEWNGGAVGRCPQCLGYKPDHAADCRLIGALKEAGYESKTEATHAGR